MSFLAQLAQRSKSLASSSPEAVCFPVVVVRRPLTHPSLEAVERFELKFCTVLCILIKILNPVIPGPQAPRGPERNAAQVHFMTKAVLSLGQDGAIGQAQSGDLGDWRTFLFKLILRSEKILRII